MIGMRRSGDAEAQEALRVAQDLAAQAPEWPLFFREIFGVDGAIARLFPDPSSRGRFYQTAEYGAIRGLLAELRRQAPEPPERHPTRVITVRVSAALHEALRNEAYQKQTSMNKLCIQKLSHDLEATTPDADGGPS